MTCLRSPFAAAEDEPTVLRDGQSHPDGTGEKWCVSVYACMHVYALTDLVLLMLICVKYSISVRPNDVYLHETQRCAL